MSRFTESPATAPEIDLEIIRQIISARIEQQKAISEPPYLGKRDRRPRLISTPALELLFGTPSLWLAVDGYRFTPVAVVKSLLLRSDGEPVDQHRFSVFVANRKEKLLKHFGAFPVSGWDKQKWSYWNEEFAGLFLASVQADPTAYRIREDVTREKLMAVCRQANSELYRGATEVKNNNYQFLQIKSRS